MLSIMVVLNLCLRLNLVGCGRKRHLKASDGETDSDDEPVEKRARAGSAATGTNKSMTDSSDFSTNLYIYN